MDANVPQDYSFQDVNPHIAIVENMPNIEHPMLVIQDNAYALAFPKVEMDGRVSTTFDLANSVKEVASEKEISDILQNSDGRSVIADTDHMYIPESMSKEDSVQFMRKIGADFMLKGRLEGNQDSIDLGEQLVTYANRLGIEPDRIPDWQRGLPGVEEGRTDMPDWQKGLPGANEYTAKEVQTVFNAVAQREPMMQDKEALTIFQHELAQAEHEIEIREQMKPVLQAFSQHVRRDKEATADYQLASVGVAPEQEVGKILQYNAGTVKIADTDHMYIPEHISRDQSLEFMNKVASKIVEQGISENNQDMVNVGKKLVSYAKRMEIPRETEISKKYKEMGIPAFGDAYRKEEIQSVFNAVAEREDCLKTASALKLFEQSLLEFEKDLKVRETMQPLMQAYSQRIARDLEHSPMHEFYSTFNNVEEAKQYARENGPRKSVTRFSAEENAKMGDQIGQETFRVYGNIAPRPYIIESSDKAIAEQLALDSIISGYKRDGSRGYGFHHDRDKDGKLMVSGLSSGADKQSDHATIRRDFAGIEASQELPKFKFENKGKAKTGNLAIVEERDRKGNLKKNDMEQHYAGLSREFT